MFPKVDVMLNGKDVCSYDYHYAQRVYIITLLNFGPDKQKGELTAAFWYEDTPNQLDVLEDANVGFQI